MGMEGRTAVRPSGITPDFHAAFKQTWYYHEYDHEFYSLQSGLKFADLLTLESAVAYWGEASADTLDLMRDKLNVAFGGLPAPMLEEEYKSSALDAAVWDNSIAPGPSRQARAPLHSAWIRNPRNGSCQWLSRR